MASQSLPTLVSVKETSERLGVSTKTVRRWIATGELPVHRFGRSIRVAETDLIAFIKMRRSV